MSGEKCSCGATAVPGTDWCYTCSPSYLRSLSSTTDIKVTIEVTPDRGPAIVKHLEKFVDESTTQFTRRVDRAIDSIIERSRRPPAVDDRANHKKQKL